MVYLPTRSSDLLLIVGCVTSSALYLSFSTLYFGSFWRIDTIFAELNKPPPSNGLQINKSGGGGLIRGLTVHFILFDLAQ